MMELSGLSLRMFSSLPVLCPCTVVAKVPLRWLEMLLSL
jgi:hypothetical protein